MSGPFPSAWQAGLDGSRADRRAERKAREECKRRGIDPDELCADGGIEAWMIVAQELLERGNGR